MLSFNFLKNAFKLDAEVRPGRNKLRNPIELVENQVFQPTRNSCNDTYATTFPALTYLLLKYIRTPSADIAIQSCVLISPISTDIRWFIIIQDNSRFNPRL